MKKCCVCGISDQDYDMTGVMTETGYYCFNCKPKASKGSNDEVFAIHSNHEHSQDHSNSSMENSVINQNNMSNFTRNVQVTNKVASLIKGFSIATGICFFLFALILSTSIPSSDGSGSLIIFFLYFGMGFVISLFMYAAGEIVQLLHNIDNNTKKI